ncbi:hypothetical protein EIP91_001786 [Steccherinum ochraceum]|uniref:DUF6535 domain-containing protein n=1 Tax=Steccherinum ochraceum TaxID=92696 RepID=A0A4V2MXM6_9APHY|nr:hypothetical protein EIP91_001786 [Steccherinum ochraceum]
MTLSDLKPDPTQTTQALLQNILLALNDTSGVSSATIPAWNGLSVSVVWVQSLLYASLACSLFAALGAVLGKQWLSRYSSVGERGTVEDRNKERHRKLQGLEVWHFRRVLEALPVLLQLSLLLFGLALSVYMWTQQRVVAIVLIVANCLGAVFYFSVIGVSVVFDDSPFQTPLSDILRQTFLPIVHGISNVWRRVNASVQSSVRYVLRHTICQCRPGVAPSAHSDLSSRQLPVTVHNHWSKNSPQSGPPLSIQVVPHKDDRLSAEALLWLLDTSTDPIVQADAIQAAHLIQWPTHLLKLLCTRWRLDFLLQQILSCFETGPSGGVHLPSSHEHRATGLCAAFLFVYWERRVLDWNAANQWVMMNGHDLNHKYDKELEVLQAYQHSSNKDRFTLYLTFLTLRVGLADLESRGKFIAYCSPRMSTQTLCTRTLFYLAQMPAVDRLHSRWSRLRAISRYYSQFQSSKDELEVDLEGNSAEDSEAIQVSVVAFAMVLGYRRVNIYKAEWRADVDGLARWTPDSSDQSAMTASLMDLYSGSDLEEEVLWHATECVFAMIARCSGMFGARKTKIDTSNKHLLPALIWAAKASPDEFGLKSPGNSLFQLHLATLNLIRILSTLPLSSNSSFREVVAHCSLFMAQPSKTLTEGSDMHHVFRHIYNRDKLFVEIIASLLEDSNDPRLDKLANKTFVRSWAQVVGRWTIPGDRRHEVDPGAFSARNLLSFAKVRRSHDQDWGDDADLIQRVAVVATWTEWRYSRNWRNKGPPGNPKLLVDHTMEVMDALHVRNALGVQGYIRDIRDDIEEPATYLRSVSTVVLQPALDALSRKLYGIEQLENISPSQIPLPLSPSISLRDTDEDR